MPAATPAPRAPAPTAARSGATLDHADVLRELVGVVAAKTGYDPSEIEPDFELEADLGVDTVKQAEILADLTDRYGVQRDENFRMADHPTVTALASYLVSAASGSAPAPSSPSPSPSPEAAPAPGRRPTFETAPTVVPASQPAPSRRAIVRMRLVSLPASGSVTPNARLSLPAAMPGRIRSRSASLPCLTMGIGGKTAKWTGLSGLVGYYVTPRLQLLARADYIKNKTAGGGLFGYTGYWDAFGIDGGYGDYRNGIGPDPTLGCEDQTIAGCDKGANRYALSVGLKYAFNLNTTFKFEYRRDGANLPVFYDVNSGSYRKNNDLFGASVVVAF